jgi:signal transduction histidine kinase
MKPLPIRAKFALWSGFAMACALGALAAGTLFNLYRKQLRESDDNILTETKELEVFLPGKKPEEIQWELDPHMGWLLFDDAGRMLRSDKIIPEHAARAALGASGVVATGTIFEGWRTQAIPAGPNRIFVVGYDIVRVHGALADLVIAYAWSLPLVVVVVVIGSGWATGRALKPFRALADAIEGIESDRLDRRVPEHPAQDEIQRLAASFNALLGRMERSFAQTKRFAADASHELRTPLTIMRSEIELILSRPDLPLGPQASLVSLQDEIARLDRITEQLLQLARFDAGQIVLKKEMIDCSALITEVCEDAELLASAAGVTLELTIDPGVRLDADGLHLRRLFLNLLDNACKYNRPHGRVWCGLKKENGYVVLRVGNTGPGIPTEMRDRVFERFFRADPSRSNTRGHGLGLALCWEIVDLHGGRLALASATASDWTEFEVRLPAS